MLFDIHTHALFSVDDGAKNIKEAAVILKNERLDGVGQPGSLAGGDVAHLLFGVVMRRRDRDLRELREAE